jgi:glucose/arabinose dehydrogenase
VTASRIAGAALAVLALVAARDAHAMLSTPGFRAVAVGHAEWPISALAVAPDGRLFAAIQANGQTSGTTPGTAEIRVYSSYATTDGAILDEGAFWATIDGVRATTNEEGLLGIALAPDFPTSKLVYVYLTTTDENQNQHVRVYRENANGMGDYLGTVATGLEPPAESTTRNGGALGFGADGCLYVGVGDNGSTSRWNAQLLVGTDPISSSESASLCTNVCLGTSEYPARTIANDGALNDAGKLLRVAVEGQSPAQPAPDSPLATQPFVFGTGLRNPVGLATHPLTGQLFVTERGDSQQSELDVVDAGSDLGWPCLEGALVSTSTVAACLVGHTAAEVYANHPSWRHPLVSHATNPALTGVVAYTGLGYPAEYYGDVFYLLRASDRIYRVDLAAPCFLPDPDPNAYAPLPFHDSTDDGDFTALYDFDGDGQVDVISFTNLTAIVQAPNPLGQQVLYVAGKQGNSNALTEDSAIFRIEYATAFTPYAGPLGRVPDSCFAGTPWENAFARTTCLPPGGPCPGAPDGTPCDDGDPCNGVETCSAGVCQHGVPAPEGTACGAGDACHVAGSCRAGTCVAGDPVPDGTPCGAADPCAGRGTCSAGACTVTGGPAPLSVRALRLRRASGGVVLHAGFRPSPPVAPQSTDALSLELRSGDAPVFSSALDHPASDPFWHARGRRMQYASSATGIAAVSLRTAASGTVTIDVRGRGGDFGALATPAVGARLLVGDQCFVADLGAGCRLDGAGLRCRPAR